MAWRYPLWPISSSPARILRYRVWQAHKTLYAGERCLRPGGTLIVVTPCPEGLSVTHPEIVAYAGGTPDAVEAGIASGAIRDLTAAALALGWANTRRHVQVSLVSGGIAADTARAIGFEPFADVQQALSAALSATGRKRASAFCPTRRIPCRCWRRQALTIEEHAVSRVTCKALQSVDTIISSPDRLGRIRYCASR